MDWIADSRLALFFKLPTVGMAISIRMAMMAMTMSNSISVKPLTKGELFGLERCERWRVGTNRNLQFMDFHCLMEQAGVPGPFEKMLQRIDAEGKWDARRTVVSGQ
jgi:hypothetical protein